MQYIPASSDHTPTSEAALRILRTKPKFPIPQRTPSTSSTSPSRSNSRCPQIESQSNARSMFSSHSGIKWVKTSGRCACAWRSTEWPSKQPPTWLMARDNQSCVRLRVRWTSKQLMFRHLCFDFSSQVGIPNYLVSCRPEKASTRDLRSSSSHIVQYIYGKFPQSLASWPSILTTGVFDTKPLRVFNR